MVGAGLRVDAEVLGDDLLDGCLGVATRSVQHPAAASGSHGELGLVDMAELVRVDSRKLRR